MNLAVIFITVGVLAVIWHVWTTVLIHEALRRRNITVSFLFLRFLAPKYAGQYKKVTRMESGKVGPLFYHWIVSINLALLAAVLLLFKTII